MSKILLIANDEIVIFNFRLELIIGLKEAGYEVLVAFPKGGQKTQEIIDMPECDKFIPLEIDRRGVNPIKDLNLIKKIKRLLKKEKPDFLLTFTIKPNLYGAYAAKKFKIKHIANVTGLGTAVENNGLLQKLTLFMYKIFMNKTECFFFQNTENMKFLQKYNIAKKNAKLLPGSGVNLKKFVLKPYPQNKIIKIFYIGRVMLQKGIVEFIEAAREITKNNCSIEFHIVGMIDDSTIEKLLYSAVNENIVKYHGSQNAVLEFYETANCIVIPTYYPEGMNNVLLESAATGRPIITTNRSGCREIVDDGINGYIVEKQDITDLVEKINKFLSLSYEEKRQMGLNGRAKVEKSFDRQIIVKKYLEELKGWKL
jgi:galacturonosyltransferase